MLSEKLRSLLIQQVRKAFYGAWGKMRFVLMNKIMILLFMQVITEIETRFEQVIYCLLLRLFEKSNHFVNILGMNRDSSFVVNGPHLALSEEFFLCTFRSYLNALVFSQFNLIRELNFTDSSMVQLGFLSEKKNQAFSPF